MDKGFIPKIVFIVIVIVLVAGGAGAYYVLKQKANKEPVLCAQNVRQCPDGSYISRIPHTCEFAQCPEITKEPKSLQEAVDISDWKTYRNEEYGFEVNYPKELEVYPHEGNRHINIYYPGVELPRSGSGFSIDIIDIDPSIALEDFVRARYDQKKGSMLGLSIPTFGIIKGSNLNGITVTRTSQKYTYYEAYFVLNKNNVVEFRGWGDKSSDYTIEEFFQTVSTFKTVKPLLVPSVLVIEPSDGETFVSGKTYLLKWQINNRPSDMKDWELAGWIYPLGLLSEEFGAYPQPFFRYPLEEDQGFRNDIINLHTSYSSPGEKYQFRICLIKSGNLDDSGGVSYCDTSSSFFIVTP